MKKLIKVVAGLALSLLQGSIIWGAISFYRYGEYFWSGVCTGIIIGIILGFIILLIQAGIKAGAW